MILYIHIPFCASKCGYCAFNSAVIPDTNLHEAYLQSLIIDIRATLGAYRAGELEGLLDSGGESSVVKHLLESATPESSDYMAFDRAKLRSVYIGGGTPSLLPSCAYERIFAEIDRHCALHNIAEITIEANPNHLSAQWCRDLASLGVNRISMGIQSFCAQKLRFLERDHSAQDIAHALESTLIFPHRSIDLIYGTPLDTPDNHKILLHDMNTACALPITHLSAYALTIEKGARFWRKHGLSATALHELDDNAAQAQIVRETASKYGFSQYEVSNFTRGHKSLHNRAYWAGEEYLGCGISAVGRVGQYRYCGQNDLSRYIKTPLHKNLESITREDLAFEALFMGLRSDVGVDLAALREYILFSKQQEQKLAILLDDGKCILRDGRLFAGDMFLADEIALWLC